MGQEAFLRAVLDEPDDDGPRLVFADWLDEQGQTARAEWVRASCALAQARSIDSDYGPLLDRERDCFRRCRPPWWAPITGVTERNDRGLFRFEVGSRTAVVRLGKAAWLGEALAGGWLEGISITWSDGLLAQAVAAWRGPVREVPLFVRPAPQITDEGLAVYSAVPRLWGLDLESRVVRNPAGARLVERADLRELSLELRLAEAEVVSSVLEKVARLTGLKRLVIKGRDRPTDENLAYLGELSGLRRLTLSDCRALTDAGLVHLRGLTALRRLSLWGCDGLTGAGVAALRQALPSLQVERV